MSFKFNKDAASEKRYINAEGVYTVTVKSVSFDYIPPRADFYARIILETSEGEATSTEIFSKAEKSGKYTRMEQFIAATCNEVEAEKYGNLPSDFTPDEEFLKLVCNRAVGRRLKVEVKKREYAKKDGTTGVAYNAAWFRRLPEGSEQPF